jgi:hypothetical protein
MCLLPCQYIHGAASIIRHWQGCEFQCCHPAKWSGLVPSMPSWKHLQWKGRGDFSHWVGFVSGTLQLAVNVLIEPYVLMLPLRSKHCQATGGAQTCFVALIAATTRQAYATPLNASTKQLLQGAQNVQKATVVHCLHWYTGDSHLLAWLLVEQNLYFPISYHRSHHDMQVPTFCMCTRWKYLMLARASRATLLPL